MQLSVIIVSYNTRDVLRDCLMNLESALEGIESEVLVVDNASSDGSIQMVREEFPWVVPLALKENVGLARGYNVALKQASGEYLLFLGSDTFPQRETMVGLLGYMDSHLEIGISTCKLVLRNGSLDRDAHRGFPTPWAALTHFSGLTRLFPKSCLLARYHLGWEDLDQPHEIDLCISHFMLVRKQVFEEIGEWDGDFFVYGEDVDFCYRVKQAGWKVMYLPQWEVLHYKGASVGIRKEAADVTTANLETRLRMLQATVEAMELFYAKHYRDKYPRWITGLVLLGIKLLGRFRIWRGRR